MRTPSDPVSPKEDTPDFKDELVPIAVCLLATVAGFGLFYLLGSYDTDGFTFASAVRWTGFLVGVIGVYGLAETLFRVALLAVAVALSGYWPIFILVLIPLTLLGAVFFFTYMLLLD